MVTQKIRDLANLVVLPHSIFALPFALAAFILAARLGPHPSMLQLFLVVVAVLAARTAAMAFNRLVDARMDARNPRTASRELPQGRVSPRLAVQFVAGASLVFLASAYLLGPHCFVLSPLVLGVLLGYSFTKRFTRWSHLVLGLALGLAPGGAWWVLRPEIAVTPLALMFAVTCWVGGFDIIYSCQDEQFDRREGIFSLPAKLGIKRALLVARMLHCLAFAALVVVGTSAQLHGVYYLGLTVIGGLFAYQHMIVSPHDLSRVNRAFFTVNGLVSVGYMLVVLVS